jgi:phosphatidate cytidylyltransferase
VTEANKNLLIRIGTAVVLLPGVLALLWWWPYGTGAIVAVAAAVMAYEFNSIVWPKLDPGQIAGIAAAAMLPVLWAAFPAAWWSLVVLVSVTLIIGLHAYYLIAGPLPEAPTRVGMVLMGSLYSGLLVSFAVGLRSIQPGRTGFSWLLLALAVTWVNDTGAYAAGRGFGKHKLYPKVSPGKTWEGFAGGMIAAVAGALICKAIFFAELWLIDCVIVGVVTSILGPVGDLSESMLKRAYGVKDSGKIIPGHGGILDRVDALLFNLPFLYLYAVYLRR